MLHISNKICYHLLMGTVVYIDGQNFLYKASDVLIAHNIISSKQELIKIDVRSVIEKLLGDQPAIIKYYGVNTIKRQKNFGDSILEKSINFANNLRQTKNYLAKTGVTYVGTGSLQVRNRESCPNCGFIDYKLVEKGVDVGLATDLVKDSFNSAIAHQILVSSDIDLIPALIIAKEQHKTLTYIAFDKKRINAISSRVDSTHFIKDTLIIEAYTKTLKN